MVRGKWFLAAVFGSMVGMAASQVFAQADVIEKRQKLMKGQSAAAKAIKGAVESKDYATVETKAKDLMGSADKIVEHFPKGSTKGKTKATAAIWEKSDDFGVNAKNLSKAAGELAAAAKSGDAGAVDAKVKAVSGACGNCHKAFRAEKYSE
ncbi:MAG TPA: cytochrome c [Candidatus Binatia bacterium]